MKNQRMRLRKGEEGTNRAYKKWEKKDYKNMKGMRGVEDKWITYI
jgi:hypothetical protein